MNKTLASALTLVALAAFATGCAASSNDKEVGSGLDPITSETASAAAPSSETTDGMPEHFVAEVFGADDAIDVLEPTSDVADLEKPVALVERAEMTKRIDR